MTPGPGKRYQGIALMVGGVLMVAASMWLPGAINGKSGDPGTCASARIVLPKGEARVEVVRTPELIAKGLMFRKSLAPGEGMLFVFPQTQELSFWMKNTLIPLDMVFIRDGTVIKAHRNAVPGSLDDISSGGPVNTVLEMAAGDQLLKDISAGDTVLWSCL